MSSNLHIETVVVGQMATNCYLVIDNESHEALIIDPGDDAEHITDILSRHQATPIMIVSTHGHFDHLMAAYALQLAYNIPFCIHEGDTFLLQTMQSSAMHFLGLRQVDPPPRITQFIKEGDSIKIGKHTLTVIETPGHTPGSVCLKWDNILFVGDTIFAGGAVGRTDFSYSQPLKLSSSIKKILSCPRSTRLLAGHEEETSVKQELPFHKT